MKIKVETRPLRIAQKVIPSDLETRVSIFLKLRSVFPNRPAFLLESVEREEQIGRYSILGFAASEAVRWEANESQNPLAELKVAMENFQMETPPPFPVGAFGYLSYDAVRAFEKTVPTMGKSSFPDALFVIPERLVLFDHFRNTITLMAISPDNPKSALNEMEAGLQKSIPPQTSTGSSGLASFHSSETRESFMQKVEKAKEYIRSGDIYQIVFSQQLTGMTEAKPIDIYRALRIINPSPYMFFLDFGNFQMIGSSPEMLVKVAGSTAETNPIAGTLPRGKTPQEDAAMAEKLLHDPKECAEHTMLVDLGRNDLGRVCQFGSVHVPRLMEIERYSHVMHLVSKVIGKKLPEKSALDVLQASFPAGTLTGAPKVRAMQIIAELESRPRGPYGGCVGYVSFTGNLDTCITIRTILMQNEKVWLQAGAGIVADSNPEREYEETLNKLEGMREAIRLAENQLQLDGAKKSL